MTAQIADARGLWHRLPIISAVSLPRVKWSEVHPAQYLQPSHGKTFCYKTELDLMDCRQLRESGQRRNHCFNCALQILSQEWNKNVLETWEKCEKTGGKPRLSPGQWQWTRKRRDRRPALPDLSFSQNGKSRCGGVSVTSKCISRIFFHKIWRAKGIFDCIWCMTRVAD